MTLRIGWFTTARGAGSRGMFEAVRAAVDDGSLDADFACVCSNREPGEDPVTDQFFATIRDRALPLVTLSSVRYRGEHGGERSRAGAPLPEWRAAFDTELGARLAPYPFDIGVLAGYMLILTPQFVAQHPLLNLHPALPGGPVGTWREVIRELIRTRAPESGVMVHLAIPQVDAGPVAAFTRYPIVGAEFDPLWSELDGEIDESDDAAVEAMPLFARIREAQMAVEAPFLVAVLAAFAAARVRATGGQLIDAAGMPAAALDLTADVAKRLTATSTRSDA
ncbi:MAG: formyltransferase family protein [Chloroflexi bacterium]|nr:formyltransferase family protein [Chloroflexota bacterium]MDA1002015.1 formyltransferase family protein [Chloroflexota bacterium]